MNKNSSNQTGGTNHGGTNTACTHIDLWLTDYLLEELDHRERETVEKHLVECRGCRVEFEARRQAVKLIESASPPCGSLGTDRREQVLSVADRAPRAMGLRFLLGSVAAVLLVSLELSWV